MRFNKKKKRKPLASGEKNTMRSGQASWSGSPRFRRYANALPGYRMQVNDLDQGARSRIHLWTAAKNIDARAAERWEANPEQPRQRADWPLWAKAGPTTDFPASGTPLYRRERSRPDGPAPGPPVDRSPRQGPTSARDRLATVQQLVREALGRRARRQHGANARPTPAGWATYRWSSWVGRALANALIAAKQAQLDEM
jgi:hypothetical protein